VGDNERAVRAFQHAMELAPDDTKIQTALGTLLCRLPNRHRQAEEVLLAVLEADPNCIDALVQLGLLYKRFGRKSDAHDIFVRLEALNPQGPKTRAAIAEIEPQAPRKNWFARLFGK
jgi:cytochrome c-type biogenesis protein CcmH/NrfG